MPFHLKSAWASLVTTLAVYIPFFVTVFKQPLAFPGLLIGAVIFQVVLLVAFHILNALATRSIRSRGDTPPLDELEQAINRRAALAAGGLLSFVVVCWYLAVVFMTLVSLSTPAGAAASLTLPAIPFLTAVHGLFAGFVLANLVYYAAIIWGYGRMTYGQSRDS